MELHDATSRGLLPTGVSDPEGHSKSCATRCAPFLCWSSAIYHSLLPATWAFCCLFSKYNIFRQVSRFCSLEKMTKKRQSFTFPRLTHLCIPTYFLLIFLGHTSASGGMMGRQPKLGLGWLISGEFLNSPCPAWCDLFNHPSFRASYMNSVLNMYEVLQTGKTREA